MTERAMLVIRALSLLSRIGAWQIVAVTFLAAGFGQLKMNGIESTKTHPKFLAVCTLRTDKSARCTVAEHRCICMSHWW
jgi:uncharacterized membrane protein YjjP (DUF1212 family)